MATRKRPATKANSSDVATMTLPKKTAAQRRDDVFARAPGRAQMAMTTPKRNAAISSSALRQIGDDSKLTKRRRRARAQYDRTWQFEAFDYAVKVGELGGLLNLQSNIVSLCGFPVRRWDDEQADWVANDPDVDDDGKASDNYDDRPANVMRNFVGPDGGQTDLMRRGAYNLFCAGEATLLGTKHPQDQGILWEFLSVRELYPDAEGNYVRKRGGDGTAEEPLPPDNFTGRMFRSDIAFSDLADSEVKRVLPILQEIVTLTMMVDAIAKSRLAANMIFIPDELSFAGSDADDGIDPENEGDAVEGDDIDLLVDELFDHMTAPVHDPGSAARLVPLVIRGPGEAGQYIQVIDLSRQLDMWAQELRQEALSRLANGLDAPPEAISGKGNVNHWTAANIDSEFIVKHIQPIGVLIADFLTWAYLRPMLEAYEDMRAEEALKFKVEFDPSPVIARADEAKSARDLSDWLSDDAILSANGFTKADMASGETIRMRRLWTLVSTQPSTFARLLPLLEGFEKVDPELIGPAQPPPAPGVAPNAPVDPTTGKPVANNPNTPTQTGKPAPADGKTPATGSDKPTSTKAPTGANTKDTGLALLTERLATAADAAIASVLVKSGSRVISLAQGKAPELRERVRAVRKDRIMSQLTSADLASLALTPDRLLKDAWSELGVQSRSWIRDNLEADGVDPMEADERASFASHALCERLNDLTKAKLLMPWTLGKNGLRIPTELVTEVLEQAAFAGAI